MIKVGIKSDFNQWYDSMFYPSSSGEVNYFFRRMSRDNPYPWVVQETLDQLCPPEYQYKSSYNSEGLLKTFSPNDLVECFDSEGGFLGVELASEASQDPNTYWVRTFFKTKGYENTLLRFWRIGSEEFVFAQRSNDQHNPFSGDIKTLFIDRNVLDGKSVTEYPMHLRDFVVIKDGLYIPYGYSFSPNLDGLGLENHISSKEVYNQISAWLMVFGG